MIEAKIKDWGRKMFPKYDDDLIIEIIKYFNSWDVYNSKDLKIDEHEDDCKLVFHMGNQVEEEELEIKFDNKEDYNHFLKVIIYNF